MRRGRPPHPNVLTPREQEVLSLIRDGLSNGQIADRLGISESGARYHVSEILSKLGVTSREEAAAWRPGREKRWSLVGGLSLLMRPAGALAARPVAIALGLLAATALALVGLGVAVNELRSEDDETRVMAPSPTPGPELLRMQELVSDAGRLLEVIAPDAYLYRVQYSRRANEEHYGFTFARPDSTEVGINRMTMPEEAAWEFFIADVVESKPEPLDLASIVYSPEDISRGASAAGASTPQFFFLETGPSGSAQWRIVAAGGGTDVVHCGLADGDPLGAIACGTPTASPTPRVSVTVTPPAEIVLTTKETAEFALAIARAYEPEAYLFRLRGRFILPGTTEHSEYSMAFSDPSGGSVIAVVFQSRNRWRIELPVPSEFDDAPRRLDLAALQKNAGEVANAAGDEVRRARPEFSLSQENGRLVWSIEATRFGEEVACSLPDDAPYSELTCEVEELTPTPTP